MIPVARKYDKPWRIIRCDVEMIILRFGDFKKFYLKHIIFSLYIFYVFLLCYANARRI